MPELRLLSAKIASQLGNEDARKEVETIISLTFDANFDAGELRRHMMQINGGKRILDDRRNEVLAKEGLTKKCEKRKPLISI